MLRKLFLVISMAEELVNKITNEIKRSGFPLEMHCLNVCSKKNTGRMPNIRYSYKGELKEIDLYAFFEEITPEAENPQYTSTSIIVECKKSKYPWVFFSSSMYGTQDVSCFIKYYSEFDLYFAKTKTPNLFNRINKKLKKNHYKYSEGIPYCLSYFEAFKNPNAPSEIYKAIDSVLSFLNFRLELRQSRGDVRGFHTQFFYPIIVLEGCLFEAEMDKDEIHVNKRDHVHLRVDYRDDIYIVDVVTKEYFETLFNIIEKDHYDFVKSISKVNFTEKHKAILNEGYAEFLREIGF